MGRSAEDNSGAARTSRDHVLAGKGRHCPSSCWLPVLIYSLHACIVTPACLTLPTSTVRANITSRTMNLWLCSRAGEGLSPGGCVLPSGFWAGGRGCMEVQQRAPHCRLQEQEAYRAEEAAQQQAGARPQSMMCSSRRVTAP
jgi:hypothetical protein